MARAILMALICGLAYWQEFEAASIKPAPPPAGPRIRVDVNGGPGDADPTLFTCRNCTVLMLAMKAYDAKYYQISGPGSQNGELFDVTAKVPDGATKEQFRIMLQNLLADRFKLALHREAKEMQAYDLIVVRNGLKVQKSVEGGARLSPGGMTVVNRTVRLRGVQESMRQLADWLSNQLDLPVTDATGLEGKYDFTLSWGIDPAPGATASDDSGPSLFTAIQSQLGLKLAPKKGTVSMIVIDHVEKVPTGN